MDIDKKGSVKSVKENLDDIAERYVDLKKGVNDLNNSNKSLTSEKYQEYLDICNELAEQFPDLVAGYDLQGNAILNVGDNATECASQLRQMYNESLKFADGDFAVSMNKHV